MAFFTLFKSQNLDEAQARRSLWSLSWVGFLSSVATLMVVSIYPIFLTEVQGASYTEAGLIEGAAMFLAFGFKSFSGVLSDIFRRRKPLIFLGSFFSVMSKLIFVAAHSVTTLSVARMADRSAKGIRSSPTDALLADLSKVNVNRGRSYGLYKRFSMIGVAVGSAVSIFLMYLTQRDYHLVFYLSMIPGIISLLVIVFLVKQPVINDEIKKGHKGWRIQDIQYLSKEFWIILSITFVLMFARFNESFIVYQARSVGWAVNWIPLLGGGMELVSALLVYPIGVLADRSNSWVLLFRGLFVLLIANVTFISINSMAGVVIGTVLAGASLGMTQGLLSMLVANAAPAELRGTAFSIYYFTIGLALSGGNVIAGRLNDLIGTTGSFCGGFFFTSLAMLMLWYVISKKRADELF